MADALPIPFPPPTSLSPTAARADVHSIPRGQRSRLVVASNRLALPDSTQTGGLATALRTTLADCEGTWVGWSGRVGDASVSKRHHDRVNYRSIGFTREEFEDYYLGFSNRALWPLLHSRPDLLCYQESWYRRYIGANQRFADEIAASADADSLVWVHDYHLLPVARLLRTRGYEQRLGFFLHTPFPSPDIARCLPRHRDTFGALRDYDLIGVQTERDVRHLRAYLSELDPAFERSKVQAFPIGVEPGQIADSATLPVAQAAGRRMRESLASRQLILGIDRLDYSKGLPARFTAYDALLERHEDLRRQVSYLQIAPISRGEVAEYQDLKHQLDTQSGAINARHGDVDWVPLRYVARSHRHEVVAALMREASVGLVTPLRDGMNLVAKEFVAAQTEENPGVLVLSEFAGAAETMHSALIVNPHDPCAVADSMAMALRMPLRERRRRWEDLAAGLQANTLGGWRREFLTALEMTRPHSLPAQAPVFAGARQ